MRRQVDLDGYPPDLLGGLPGRKRLSEALGQISHLTPRAPDSVDFGALFVQKLLRKLPVCPGPRLEGIQSSPVGTRRRIDLGVPPGPFTAIADGWSRRQLLLQPQACRRTARGFDRSLMQADPA
jgi:hypothetical protein